MKTKLKANLILANWVLSFMGLCVVSPFWVVMVGACWFIVSTALFVLADQKGWMENITNNYSNGRKRSI